MHTETKTDGFQGTADQAAQASAGALATSAPQSRPPAGRSSASAGLSDTMSIIATMERLAKNKDVDVAKMKEVRELGMAMLADIRRDHYYDAMAAAQIEMSPIVADAKNSETKSKYASHAALDRALRPIYTKHGFSLTFDTEPCSIPEMMTFVCFATAKGHTHKHTIDLPVDGKGPKGGNVMSRTHAASSGVTYAMRILLKMVFNIAIDRDDDGNAAGKTITQDDRPKVSQEQIDALIDLCDAKGCPHKKFLGHIDVAAFKDIPAADYERHIALLNTYGPTR